MATEMVWGAPSPDTGVEDGEKVQVTRKGASGQARSTVSDMAPVATRVTAVEVWWVVGRVSAALRTVKVSSDGRTESVMVACAGARSGVPGKVARRVISPSVAGEKERVPVLAVRVPRVVGPCEMVMGLVRAGSGTVEGREATREAVSVVVLFWKRGLGLAERESAVGAGATVTVAGAEMLGRKRGLPEKAAVTVRAPA